jgi:hypothetical protein
VHGGPLGAGLSWGSPAATAGERDPAEHCGEARRERQGAWRPWRRTFWRPFWLRFTYVTSVLVEKYGDATDGRGQELVDLNKRFLKGLTQQARLKANSKLRVPGVGGAAPAADDWKLFGDVVGYRHWTFPDETDSAIRTTGVSYHLGVISIRIGTLTWLRLPCDFESRPA